MSLGNDEVIVLDKFKECSISFLNIGSTLRYIVQKVISLQRIVDIDLSDNIIDDSCVELLCECIFSDPNCGNFIRRLNLTNNRITVDGLRTLASVLLHKSVFEYLIISINFFS